MLSYIFREFELCSTTFSFLFAFQNAYNTNFVRILKKFLF